MVEASGWLDSCELLHRAIRLADRVTMIRRTRKIGIRRMSYCARLVSQPVRDSGAHRGHVFRHRVHLAGELQRLARAHADATERRAAYEPRLDLGRVDVARCVGEADAEARAQPGHPAAGVERDAAAARAHAKRTLAAEHSRIEVVAG